jgi:aminopeptidase N
VETNDLQQAIKDVLGLNLDWFFDEWILRGGEPHFRVHYEDLKYTDGSKATEIAIEQIQKMDEIVRAFKMPIQLEVHYEDGSKDVLKEMIDEDFEVVKIPNRGNKKISYVLFDPNSNVLKQLTFKKSFQELQEQLERAIYMLDRYDALVGMRNIPIEEKREVLYKAMEREKHEAMIIELISQLGKDNASSSVKILKGLMSFPKASVRDHLLKTLTPNATYQDLYFVSLNDSSYDVVKTALEMLSVQFQGTNEMPAILKRVEGVNGMNHNIEVKMLELSILNELNVQAAKDRLKELASYKFEFRTRIQAFQALKSTNVCDQQVIDYLFQAMLCSNSRLASPAADLANYFGSQMTQKYAMKKFFEAKGYSDAEKEVLLKYLPILK